MKVDVNQEENTIARVLKLMTCKIKKKKIQEHFRRQLLIVLSEINVKLNCD